MVGCWLIWLFIISFIRLTKAHLINDMIQTHISQPYNSCCEIYLGRANVRSSKTEIKRVIALLNQKTCVWLTNNRTTCTIILPYCLETSCQSSSHVIYKSIYISFLIRQILMKKYFKEDVLKLILRSTQENQWSKLFLNQLHVMMYLLKLLSDQVYQFIIKFYGFNFSL